MSGIQGLAEQSFSSCPVFTEQSVPVFDSLKRKYYTTLMSTCIVCTSVDNQGVNLHWNIL